jgi:hypothetical protein
MTSSVLPRYFACLYLLIFIAGMIELLAPAYGQAVVLCRDRNFREVPCESGGGGGRRYSDPIPSGPSPEEIARRQRIDAGNSANERGKVEFERGDMGLAVLHFEEAAKLWPEDATIRSNLARARAAIAKDQGNLDLAAKYYRDALQHRPDKDVQLKLDMVLDDRKRLERERIEQSGDWDKLLQTYRAELARATDDSKIYWQNNIRRALGRRALVRQDYDTAVRELTEYHRALTRLRGTVTKNLKDSKALPDLRDDKQYMEFKKAVIISAEENVRGVAEDLKANQKYLNMAQAGKATEAGQVAAARGDLTTARQQLEAAVKLEPSPDRTRILQQILKRQEDAQRLANLNRQSPPGIGCGPNASASAQADCARQNPGVFDGTRGSAQAVSIPPFVKSVTIEPFATWQPEKRQRLQSTDEGRQIIEAQVKELEALRRSDENLDRIRAQLRAAGSNAEEKQKLNQQWADEANNQTAINSNLNKIEKKAEEIVVRVQLDDKKP